MTAGAGGPRHAVLVVGDAALDLDLVLGPRIGDEKRDAIAGRRGLGGTGANAAVAAARLGSKVSLATVLGDDAIGDWIARQLAVAGVATEFVHRVAGRSTVAVILHEGAERSLIVDRGVADELAWLSGDTLARAMADADAVYLSAVPLEVVEQVVALGHGGLIVGVEARQLVSTVERWHRSLAAARIVVTNDAGALALGPIDVPIVVTHGADGATLTHGGRSERIAAPTVDAVDATGAGDCLAGTIAHFLDRLPLAEVVRRAVIAASLSTTVAGAQAGYPDERTLIASAGAKAAVR